MKTGSPDWRILFVDDDPFYRDLAANALSSAAMACDVAADGDAALMQLETGAFDLLIVDLSMPGRSGFEVVETVRADPRHADLPIIVVTGSDDDATISRAFHLGATSFMVKPLNWQLFVQNVRFVLQAAHARIDLRRAKRTAEFMSELKTRLVGTLVTEFQSPLRAAFNFSRLLEQQADGPISSPLYVEWVGELHRALGRLSSVHLKMLNFGRSLSNQIQLDEQVIDLTDLVSAAVEAAQASARRRSLSLAFNDTLGVPVALRADAVLISNALGAVLDNAVKFTPRGQKIVVTLGLKERDRLVVSIEDGVPTLSQNQIDEILGVGQFAVANPEAVEATTALKMCRILIEAHQGQMHIRAGDRGMETSFVLPKERRIAAVEPLRAAIAAARPAAQPSRRSPALLRRA